MINSPLEGRVQSPLTSFSTKDILYTGLAEGLYSRLDAAGFIFNINDRNIKVDSSNIPDKARGYGDKYLFNYLLSVGTIVSNQELDALSKEEEPIWVLIKFHRIEKKQKQ